jgi:heat shock protein HslJ
MVKHFLMVVLVGMTVAQAQAQGLEGTRWTLAYYVQGNQVSRAEPGGNATAEFLNGSVQGSTGCNQFGASYAQDGQSLSFGSARQTLMACLEASRNAQEQAYVKGLERVRSFTLARGVLSLLDEAGKTVLIFTQARSAAILGAAWVVTAINTGDAISSVLEGTRLTVGFDAAGRVSGSTGCNQFSAPFSRDGFGLELGPAASTKRACAGDEESKQEQAFLNALEGVAGFRITGDRLELYAADGRTLVSLTRSL